MKICIDVKPTLKSTSTGLGKFTYSIIKALRLAAGDLEIILYYEKGFFDFKKRPPKFKDKRISYYNGHKKEKPQADIYLTSSYDFNPPKNGKFIQIIHDLIPLAAGQFASEDAKNILLELLPARLNRADAVVCVSKNTKEDLGKFYPSSKNKATVIYNTIDPSFQKIDNEKRLKKHLKKLGVNDRYLLFVSAIERRKNLLSLIRVFSFVKDKYPNLKIVVAGKKASGYKKIEEFVRKSKCKDDIIFLGYVKQKDLVYLYNGASIFIYPSFYEGFGLPIVEAFRCGTPVITSNLSSMKEIAEGAAELINPYDPKDIANAIKKILNDKSYQKELIEKGLKKAQQFSLKKMGQAYLNLLKSLL